MGFGCFCLCCCIWESKNGESRLAARTLLFREFSDCGGDTPDFFFAQFGIHRQRQNLACNVLCVGEVAGLVSERGIEWLQVQRHGIIDGAADFAIGEEFLKCITAVTANRVLMKDVPVTIRHDWSANSLYSL